MGERLAIRPRTSDLEATDPVFADECQDRARVVLASSIGHALERHGLIERDMDNAWLAGASEAGPRDDPNGAAHAAGFSLHAGIEIAPHRTLRAVTRSGHRGTGASRRPRTAGD